MLAYTLYGVFVEIVEVLQQFDLGLDVCAFGERSQCGFLCVRFQVWKGVDERKIHGAVVIPLDEGEAGWQVLSTHGAY